MTSWKFPDGEEMFYEMHSVFGNSHILNSSDFGIIGQ